MDSRSSLELQAVEASDTWTEYIHEDRTDMAQCHRKYNQSHDHLTCRRSLEWTAKNGLPHLCRMLASEALPEPYWCTPSLLVLSEHLIALPDSSYHWFIHYGPDTVAVQNSRQRFFRPYLEMLGLNLGPPVYKACVLRAESQPFPESLLWWAPDILLIAKYSLSQSVFCGSHFLLLVASKEKQDNSWNTSLQSL